MSSQGTHVSNSPYFNFLGTHMKIILTSRQTHGQFSMIEGTVPINGDGGLHVHHREDEAMYLLDGELEVTIGDRVFMLLAGESYFAPRGVPQRLRNIGSVPARGLLVTTPGGFDEFIAQAAKPSGPTAEPLVPPTIDELNTIMELTETFGISVLELPALATA